MFGHNDFDKLDRQFERRFESNWNMISRFSGVVMVLSILFALLMLVAGGIGVYWLVMNVL